MDGSAGRWSRVALLGRANRTTFLADLAVGKGTAPRASGASQSGLRR